MTEKISTRENSPFLRLLIKSALAEAERAGRRRAWLVRTSQSHIRFAGSWRLVGTEMDDGQTTVDRYQDGTILGILAHGVYSMLTDRQDEVESKEYLLDLIV
jgi:23S rRNA G2069 N7-methylase RlmK/C1962 C5-methylase RlmI